MDHRAGVAARWADVACGRLDGTGHAEFDTVDLNMPMFCNFLLHTKLAN